MDVGVLLLCTILAFLVQTAALFTARQRRYRLLPLVLMTLLPLTGAGYTAVVRPTDSWLGWEFRAGIWLWIFAAVLVGCGLAFGIWSFLTRR